MQKNDVPVLTSARQLQAFFRIKHQIWYGDSKRQQILESTEMFIGYHMTTLHLSNNNNDKRLNV